MEPIRAIGRFRLPDAIGGQVILVGLMTAALVIFIVARLGSPAESPSGAASPSPTLVAVVAASPTNEATPVSTRAPTSPPVVTPSPAPTAAQTTVPMATPAPTPAASVRTYTVQKGDISLYGIGLKLGVSWQAIAKANGIKAPWTIHRGDVLIIP